MRNGQERFAALISEVARRVTRRRSSDACCGDLTLEQFETLQAIAGSRQATMGTLSATLDVDLSTMSRNVSVLVRNGYLRRARTGADARIVLVQLTVEGQTALTTLRCGERDVLGDVYQRIPPTERAAVARALEVLRGCLSENRAEDACCAPVSLRRIGS